VYIETGTTFNISSNVSIFFYGKVLALGTIDSQSYLNLLMMNHLEQLWFKEMGQMGLNLRI